jgi:hypothetical protein
MEVYTHRLFSLASNFAKWKVELAILMKFAGFTGFFPNLLTCAEGHGNPCNAVLGVVPPTV